MLLQGITLSANQQTKLDAIREADRKEMEANRDAQRADMEAIRAARESGDSAKVKQLMDAQRAKMNARNEQQISAIRAILTPDQLPTFDANVAEMKKRMEEGGMRGRGPRPPGR
jgi:Spy/CpxP family protein refolding chaperone